MNTINVIPGLTANIYFEGYFYNRLNAIYLSASDVSVFPYVSTVNLFPDNPTLSAAFTSFTGYPWNNYSITSDNRLKINFYNNNISTFDVIIANNAGYSKLSNKNLIINNNIAPSPTPTSTPTPTPTPAPPSVCLDSWSLTNLTLTTFRNGDSIPQITNQEAWNTATGPGWCHYDNNPANDALYGKLYNRYAVTDARGLAPEGFHIPTLAEWVNVITCLGGSDAGGGIWPVAGAKMKTTGTIQDEDGLWNTPNVATNESLFSVEPAGCRTGGFINLHARGSFWVYDSNTCINFNNGASYVYIGGDSPTVGYSIRLKQGN